MPTYLVTWMIDIEADTPRDAAIEALKIQLDINSIANVFLVEGISDGTRSYVDLGATE